MPMASSVVPGREAEILEIALKIEEAEQAIERSVAAGSRLDKARLQFRYHQLQSS